jgi:hypothetical protein
MARFLVVLGLVILLVGLLWPYLARIGLGRLPGDFVIQRDNVTFYFPLMTCLLLSVLFQSDPLGRESLSRASPMSRQPSAGTARAKLAAASNARRRKRPRRPVP